MRDVIPFVLLLAIILGCSTSKSGNKTESVLGPRAETRYQNGAKLVRQYIKSKDETNIYQTQLRVQPPFFLNGKTLNGDHWIELQSMGSFTGSIPKCESSKMAFTILHGYPNKKDWHYPPNVKVAVTADGQRLDLKVTNQDQIDYDDGKYWESIIIPPPCELYSKLSDARQGTIQIGPLTLNLSAENIAAFRDFNNEFTLK